MKRYAEPNKEFKTQDWWGRTHSFTLDHWLWWLEEKNAEWYGKIDPELQDMVMKLNTRGYITQWSCAGHDGDAGYIVFYGLYTRADIDELLDPYYLKIIDYTLLDDAYYKKREEATRARFPEYVSPDIEYLPHTVVTFQGVGQSKKRKHLHGRQLVLIGK